MRPVPDAAEIGIGSGDRKAARIQETESLPQRRFRLRGDAFAPKFLGGVVSLSLIVLAGAAQAQMQLPGAVGGARGSDAGGERREGSGNASAAPSSYAPPKPVIVKAPTEDTIVGHALAQDGTKGEMVFGKSGDGLALSTLRLPGDSLAKAGTACIAEVALPTPITAVAAGRPAGAVRYNVPVPVCPFAIDILDGAVLVSRADATCEIAGCRIAPAGLWGPSAADINPKRAKELERERARLETVMRANYRALTRKAGKDRDAVKAVAKGQAAFSSDREMTCRDYSGETAHGFCSTRITQARALALMAQFGTMPEGPHGRSRRSRPALAKKAPAADPDAQ